MEGTRVCLICEIEKQLTLDNFTYAGKASLGYFRKTCKTCISKTLSDKATERALLKDKDNAKIAKITVLSMRGKIEYEREIIYLQNRITDLTELVDWMSEEKTKTEKENDKFVKCILNKNSEILFLKSKIDSKEKQISDYLNDPDHREKILSKQRSEKRKKKAERASKKKNVSVYFIQSERGVGPVKIGKTTDVNKRLKGIQTGHPEKLKIVKHYDGVYPHFEKELHKKFSKYRLSGEWFDEKVLSIQI